MTDNLPTVTLAHQTVLLSISNGYRIFCQTVERSLYESISRKVAIMEKAH